MAIYDAHDTEIDIAILDVTMPKLDGNETCRALRERRSDLPVIFCSGDAADVADDDVTSTGLTRFLHTPYGRDDLVAVLREADLACGWSNRYVETHV